MTDKVAKDLLEILNSNLATGEDAYQEHDVYDWYSWATETGIETCIRQSSHYQQKDSNYYNRAMAVLRYCNPIMETSLWKELEE